MPGTYLNICVIDIAHTYLQTLKIYIRIIRIQAMFHFAK